MFYVEETGTLLGRYLEVNGTNPKASLLSKSVFSVRVAGCSVRIVTVPREIMPPMKWT